MTESVTPQHAATVILVRDRPPDAWECYMVRRHVGSEFAPDVYVFPGGKVEAGDRDPSLQAYIDEGIRSHSQVDFSDEDQGFRIAALRELFEEAGVLLGVGMDASPLTVVSSREAEFARYRKALHSGELTLASLAHSAGVKYVPGTLVPFSYWVTPLRMPRRYDTRFFLAPMPEGQKPLHDAVETTHGTWISPGAALTQFAEGSFPLVYATIKHLERMARFSEVSALYAGITQADLAPVMPKVSAESPDGFLLPGDPGYDHA